MSRFPPLDDGVVVREFSGSVPMAPRDPSPPPSQASEAITKRLVERMTFGQTPDQMSLLRLLGPEAYINHHLNPAAINDAEVDAMLAGPEFAVLTFSPHDLWLRVTQPTYDSWRVVRPFVTATLLRQTFSKRQLFERMVEFWNDHFNTYLYADFVDAIKLADDRSVARAHALGSFRDLLLASAQSPSMLSYLNNNVSTAEHPNENYGREFLELHTMGVDNGYTQQDVMQVARCFTGWRFDYPWDGPGGLEFVFDPGMHDFGEKLLFAGTPHELRIPAGGGVQDGIDIIDAIARHPSTARHISTKLLKKFWGEQPPTRLVDAITRVYTRSDGNIREVMRAILREVLAVNTPRKFKRPHHLMISALRATGTTFTDADSVFWNTYTIGQPLFQWPPPNGYPDSIGYWVGSQLPRWSMGASLMAYEYWTTTLNIDAFLAGAVTRDAIINRIVSVLFAGSIADTDRQSLTRYLGPTPGHRPSRWRVHETIGLAIGSPSFQWI